MGHSHGRAWTRADIDGEVLSLASGGVMPSTTALRLAGRNDLACQVARLGINDVAQRLGLRLSGSETHRGQAWERHEAAVAEGLGLVVERQTTKAPFDLLIGGVRVDVKSGKFGEYRNARTGGVARGYFFSGLKLGRAADAFDVLCVDGNLLLARFLIPAESASVSTLTITPSTMRGVGLYSRFRADSPEAFRAFFLARKASQL